MDTYYLMQVKERIEVLKERDRCFRNGHDEFNRILSERTAGEYHHQTMKQLRQCMVIQELLEGRKVFTEEAEKGFELLVTPNERYRKLRGQGLIC